MRILFLIRALGIGGAESQLSLLARRLRSAEHEVSIVTLYPGGRYEPELRKAGVRLLSIDKRGRYHFVSTWYRLVRIVQSEHPTAIYSVLTAANLLSATLRPIFPRTCLIWTVQASYIDLGPYDRWVRFTSSVEPRFARFSDKIIVNSQAGAEHAAASGFPSEKLTVVRNGVDTERFRADETGRARVRSEWGIETGQKLVGLVGRIDPMKDHQTFLAAAALVAERRPDVHFVCVGEGPHDYWLELRRFAQNLGLSNRLLWVPPRLDMPAVYNALDVLTLSSRGEGLPNVVAEAMSCGVPCVVTNVGDSAWIVGDTGVVVPPGSAAALANGIEGFLRRRSTPEECNQRRMRILENLGAERLVRETEEVVKSAASGR